MGKWVAGLYKNPTYNWYGPMLWELRLRWAYLFAIAYSAMEWGKRLDPTTTTIWVALPGEKKVGIMEIDTKT